MQLLYRLKEKGYDTTDVSLGMYGFLRNCTCILSGCKKKMPLWLWHNYPAQCKKYFLKSPKQYKKPININLKNKKRGNKKHIGKRLH